MHFKRPYHSVFRPPAWLLVSAMDEGGGPRLSEPQHLATEVRFPCKRTSCSHRTRCGSESRGPRADFVPSFGLVVWLVLGLWFLSAPRLHAQGAVQREYEIKAAYLYNFINYINWPEQALPPAGGTITIGVIGENPFGSALAPLAGKRIKGRTLAVKECSSLAEAANCQIVFISPSEKQKLEEI